MQHTPLPLCLSLTSLFHRICNSINRQNLVQKKGTSVGYVCFLCEKRIEIQPIRIELSYSHQILTFYTILMNYNCMEVREGTIHPPPPPFLNGKKDRSLSKGNSKWTVWFLRQKRIEIQPIRIEVSYSHQILTFYTILMNYNCMEEKRK